VITAADTLNFPNIRSACEHQNEGYDSAKKLCSRFTGWPGLRCLQACVDGLIARPNGGLGPQPAPPPSAPPTRPVRPPDSFERALRECVMRALDSGGSAPAVCSFERPLDEMDFGQTHCNARCAAIAGAMH
jgi:hypothetical protein